MSSQAASTTIFIGLLVAACSTPTADEACFTDEQCAGDEACIEGRCAEASRDSATGPEPMGPSEALDLGGGSLEGEALTCASVRLIATNAGCEFWAVDLPNYWVPGSPYSLDIPTEQTFAVVVANTSDTENAEVNVYFGNESTPQQSAVVATLGTYAFLLPNDLQTSPEGNLYGRAFRVESDVPITAYQFQPLDNTTPVFSNDASSLLPGHVLQSDYIAITDFGVQSNAYPSGWDAVPINTGAFVTVVGTQDDTQLELVPTTPLIQGSIEGLRLARGQTFTIISDPTNPADDFAGLSGTRVTADKPVAVFSGNIATSVPWFGEGCCRDHVEHQLLPAVAWGTRYAVPTAPDPVDIQADDPVLIRLVGAYDNTPLRYPSGQPSDAPTVLNAHQETVFVAEEPFVVESDDPDKPFAAAMFLYSTERADPDGDLGDPAMVVLPSLEQFVERYVFLTPFGYRVQVVTVIAPVEATVVLDGTPLPSGAAIGASDGRTWGRRRAVVEPGAHVLEADVPVSVIVIGYDDAVSYAYTGGSAVNPIADVPPAP